MNSKTDQHGQEHLDLMFLHALQALPPSERAMAEAYLAECSNCRADIEKLRPIIGAFTSWPTDVLRPSRPLWDRLAARIAKETGATSLPEPAQPVTKPEWDEVAPGISVKILAADPQADRVSMLVRLEPKTDYPPHCHAGVEELHLLHGELMVDEKKLSAGDYLRAEVGSMDHRVWTETGCTCLLLTSINDALL